MNNVILGENSEAAFFHSGIPAMFAKVQNFVEHPHWLKDKAWTMAFAADAVWEDRAIVILGNDFDLHLLTKVNRKETKTETLKAHVYAMDIEPNRPMRYLVVALKEEEVKNGTSL